MPKASRDRSLGTLAEEMNPFSLPPLSTSDLSGYREDPAGLARFEKRFTIPCQIGFLSVFSGIIASVIFAKGTFWPIPFIVGGGFLLVVGLLLMFFSTPRAKSGQPMKKYWNKDPNAEGDQIIYVCEDSKTYFIRTWAKKTPGQR
jgi:hypothetical protein